MNTIWKCRFCNETQIKRGKILKHEAKCTLNPGNKLCFTCQNLVKGSKQCTKGIDIFNVYTSGISCSAWSAMVTGQ